MKKKIIKKNKTKRVPKRIPEQNNTMEETKRYNIKTKKNKKNKKHPKLWKTIKIIILVLLLVAIITGGIIIGKLYGIWKEAKLDIKQVVIPYENSIVKDKDGTTIAVLSGDENRAPVAISEMSGYLPKAFVAIEDERFYEHKGVDVKRTGAATLTYILHRGKSSFGGSTITQQMIKNITKDDDRSWQRKVKEMSRSYYIEQEMSKDQILELYLNLIFLGGQSYGVEVASQYYFSKSAKDLTLTESAFLAGINNSPNAYSPFSTEEDDINQINKRTKIVLDKMHQLGPEHKAGITEEEYNTAIAELENGLAFNKGTITQTIYSYHTDAAINQVKSELKEKHPDWTNEFIDAYVKGGGLTIYTTQNTEYQTALEDIVKNDKYIKYSKKVTDENGNYVTAQTASVVIDHKTGYVLATVGGIGEKTTSFGLNRATQSYRQTGSSMKPLAVLCPGIDKGIITPGTVYDDITYSSGKFANFKNYGYSSKGLLTIRYVIAPSQNIPMLKGISDIGVSNSVEFLNSVGINVDESHQDLTLALGSQEVKPIQMAGAYAAIANDGVYIEPTFYTKVVDGDGNVVLQAEQETRTVMSSATAYVIKEILTEVVKTGTIPYGQISGISVGAKSGTTSDNYDLWACGFSPYYTVATWYGFDTNETISYSGYSPAGLIWDATMEAVNANMPKAKFSDTKPSNVTSATICKCSGKLATDLCQNDPRGNQAYTEYFIKGTAPTEKCTCHVEAKICKDTGLLANEYCTNTETKVYITRPDTETGNWQKASDAQYMLTIKDVCTKHTKPVEPEKPKETENTTTENTTTENTTTENTTTENTTVENTTTENTNVVNEVSGNTTGNNTTSGNTNTENKTNDSTIIRIITEDNTN